MKSIQKNKIERKNLSQKAYFEIRKRIYNNEIKSGELIKESEIAKELGMSRTPVREAIQMLKSEDIIEVRDGIGAYVKVLSFKNIKDIFEVRKALEAIAARVSIFRIPKSAIEELENDFNTLLKNYKNGTLIEKEFIDMDMKLHKLIIAYSDNDYVKEIFDGINLKIKQFQFISYENLNSSEESIYQHLKILRLIKDKNLEELLVCLENHIDWSSRGLLF